MIYGQIGNHPLARVAVGVMRAPKWVWVAFAIPVVVVFAVLLVFGAAFAALFLLLSAPVRAFRRLRAPAGSALRGHRGDYRENVRVAVTSARVIDP
ncbi:MAG TPA: hypothetical protein VHQ47_03390 [Phycisphaerae bacterium]|jgi:hypothetical protein|nr:hypothetical protein [Phycisphaerae bacterium]